ncbi:gasdermin-E-like isoform X2 [Oryzias latipes]|uniref:Gasdermin pore forming domain-containing protein n=1 Tax=Oryzias latipes TaxID=8090 RepID=H2LKI2_ORYLA|nr:gasdermin-E-like isoform X2 [Oryzias latipes]
MFSNATANFVRQIDPNGSLIHVSRLNDSDKLVPMGLVVKRNRIWAWQRPKYRPTDFILSDLLQGDLKLEPGVSQMDFLTYKGTYIDKKSAMLDVRAGGANAGLEGQGASKLHSSFDNLKKEELDVRKLLSDSSNRLVDMHHVLVQQLEKRADVLAVVKERILTTSPCSVTLRRKQQCGFHGVLSLLSLLGSSVRVCVQDLSNVEMNSDVSLEIPSGTVIAYSVLELQVQKNGHYDICLQPGRIGGFADNPDPISRSLHHSTDTVDSLCNWNNPKEEVVWGVRQNVADLQWADLAPLADLPQSTRYPLINQLQETLTDRAALSYLQAVLEELCDGDTVESIEESSEIQRKSTFLDQQDPVFPAEDLQRETAKLKAVYLLVSTMDELPDEALGLLSESRPVVLLAFDELLSSLKGSGGSISIDSIPVPLQDNQAFQQAEQLFYSIGVALRRDAEQLWMESGREDEVLLLLLSFSMHGLSLLLTGC